MWFIGPPVAWVHVSLAHWCWAWPYDFLWPMDSEQKIYELLHVSNSPLLFPTLSHENGVSFSLVPREDTWSTDAADAHRQHITWLRNKPLLSQATEMWRSSVTTEKDNKNLYKANFKMLPRNTEKDLNKWKGNTVFLTRKTQHHTKVSIISKLIYIFNAVPMKICDCTYVYMLLKLLWKNKKAKVREKMTQKSIEEKLALLDTKTCNSTIIKNSVIKYSKREINKWIDI